VPASRKGGIDEVLVCRYSGASPSGTPVGGHSHRGRLVAGAEVTKRRSIMELRSQLNGLASAREPEGSVTTCPFDSGAGYYMLFRYPFRPPVVVVLMDRACSSTVERNDGGDRLYEPTRGLVRRLEGIASLPGPGSK
jgi:hypothetical protein